MFKRSLVAVAAGLLSAGASFAAPVVFDTNTSAGVITFDNMVWQAGNALVKKALSAPVTIDTNGDGVADAQLLHTYAQARLAAFTLTGGGSLALPATNNYEITYQADFWEIATGIGGTTAGFSLAAFMPSSIKFYFDSTVAPGSDGFGNNQVGSGYGGGIQILGGTLTGVTGNYTDFTRLNDFLVGLGSPSNPNWTKTSLDCDATPLRCAGLDGIDQAPGTLTNVGNGNNQLTVDVTYQNNAFFKSDISALTLDLAQTVGIGVPFNNGNPWTQVVGQTPFFSLVGGTRVNGADCRIGGQSQAGTNSADCDQLLQTTGLTTFTTHVPEPSSVALVGLALLGAGAVARRTSRKQ